VSDRAQFGSWKAQSSLGRGGQGEVFLATKPSHDASALVSSLDETLAAIARTYNREDRRQHTEKVAVIIRAIAAERSDPVGALKVLHQVPDKAAAEKALGRMQQELAALAAIQHDSLVRLYDSNLNERWFVMEYLRCGTLSGHLGRTRGNVLASLKTFRPLVEAVAKLHEKGYVHRDIKPDNIFVADDGHLVLAGCGKTANFNEIRNPYYAESKTSSSQNEF